MHYLIKRRFCNPCADSIYVIVHVDSLANGYRLPYYDEWMAIARGRKEFYKFIWGEEKDSITAAKYAWFSKKDPGSPQRKLDPINNPMDISFIEYSCGKHYQKSRPVGTLMPNDYGLYDISGLVCEWTMLPGKSRFGYEVLSCKGGFLTDSLYGLNLGAHCDYTRSRDFRFRGARLVRRLR